MDGKLNNLSREQIIGIRQ